MSKPSTVPLKTSLDFGIEDLEKPLALHVVREDFAADNKLSFNGKFKGKWTVKLNSSVGVGGSLEAPKLSLGDDAQLNGTVGASKVQLKFKPAKVSAQWDFGHHQLQTWKEVSGKTTWLNPYVYFESDRAFKKRLIGLGLNSNIERCLRLNSRFNLNSEGNDVNWDMSDNLLWNYRGFFANVFYNYKIASGLHFNERKALVGYEHRGFNANLELKGAKGSIRDWKLETAALSAAYDLGQKGTYAAILTLSKSAGEPAAALDQDVTLAYRNKLGRNLDVKSKLNLKGQAALFLNYKLQEGLSLNASLASNIANNTKKGFLELPFDLGLKLKLDY